MVIDCGKKYFPTVAAAWDDARVTLVCGDASKYVEDPANEDQFDIIVCDSSDPVGPAQALFEPPFFRAMHRVLKAGGRISTQAESYWLHLDLIQNLASACSIIFPEVHYATTQIMTYPGGQIGLLQLQKTGDDHVVTKSPVQSVRRPDASMQLSYYSPELHAASFILPAFAQKAFEDAKARGLNSLDEQARKKLKV